jgi:hypothetical protein
MERKVDGDGDGEVRTLYSVLLSSFTLWAGLCLLSLACATDIDGEESWTMTCWTRYDWTQLDWTRLE